MELDYSSAGRIIHRVTGKTIGYVGVKNAESRKNRDEIRRLLEHALAEGAWNLDDFGKVKEIIGYDVWQSINGIKNQNDYSDYFSFMKNVEVIDLRSVVSQIKNIERLLLIKKPNLRVLRLEDIQKIEDIFIGEGLQELRLKNMTNLKKIFGLENALNLQKFLLAYDKECHEGLYDNVAMRLHDLLNKDNNLKELTLPLNIIGSFDRNMIKKLEEQIHHGLTLRF
jgi:hypothetical protein